MQQIVELWTRLGARKRMAAIGAAFITLLMIFAIARMAATPNMLLLYSGLEAATAGEVVRALEEKGARFDIRGDSIYVEANQRDTLRMTLASEGLPAAGGRGYELLDALTGFGTTSQMFDAAYWRAKEGELARTIVSSPHILHARVHIANTTSSPFARSANPTASVAVTPAGGRISVQQAEALRYLVASAVAGLSIADVAVIDSNGGVLGASEEAQATVGAADRVEDLRDRVLRLVEARVGQGNAVVEISVDTVTEREEIKERRFDPEGRVAISTDTEERNNSNDGQNGNVTVASNLPDGDASNDNSRRVESNESRERVNYEVSETERQIVRVPGAIRRITVAVLVNGISKQSSPETTNFEPRPIEELDALRELVASAVGFDDTRGDVITIKSMDLPPVLARGTEPPTGIFSAVELDPMTLAKIAVLGIVALAVILFVLRPILKQPTQNARAPAIPKDGPPAGSQPVLNGEIEPTAANALSQASSLVKEPLEDPSANDPGERLRVLIGQRRDDTVALLRSWLEDEEKTV